MPIREAVIADTPQIQVVRHSVFENTISDPTLVTNQDCETYLTQRGEDWAYEVDAAIVGFSIVDLEDNSVWALFLHSDYERKEFGRQLYDIMLDWYFDQTKQTLWLGTTPNTRAAAFYKKAGWIESGKHGDEEIKFEMTAAQWQAMRMINA